MTDVVLFTCMNYKSSKRRKSKPHILLTKAAIANALGLSWRTVHRDFIKRGITITDLIAVSQYICSRLQTDSEDTLS